MFHSAFDGGQDNVKGLTDCSRKRTARGMERGPAASNGKGEKRWDWREERWRAGWREFAYKKHKTVMERDGPAEREIYWCLICSPKLLSGNQAGGVCVYRKTVHASPRKGAGCLDRMHTNTEISVTGDGQPVLLVAPTQYCLQQDALTLPIIGHTRQGC